MNDLGLLYQRSGQFPTNRSTLYERALRVLLEEWNGAKEIPIEQLYKGLDTKRKELILSQIAYDTFSKDQLFFPRRTVVKQIEQLLPELLPDEKFVDGNLVLRDIEVQHGLLVERAESIYSFSHLTIQEFLTAQHIDYNNISIEPLVDRHLCDKRWREVFLLLAGLRNADNLLLAMEQKIHSLMDTPKLQDLLTWVEKVTDTSSGDIQPVGKRAIAIALTNASALAYANAYGNNYLNNYALDKSNALANAYANNYANAYGNNYVNTYTLAKAFTNTLKNFIDYAQWSKKLQVYQNINFPVLIDTLEKLQLQIPNKKETIKILQAFTQRIIKTWLEAFALTPEMLDLSELEIKALDNYLYANLLMIECKKAAVRVSPETWSGIESRMLLPLKN